MLNMLLFADCLWLFADCLLLLTEWREFRSPDFIKVKSLMKNPIIFDGRNLYNRLELENMGFELHQI